MTFEAFQATAKEFADLRKAGLDGDYYEDQIAGRVYCGQLVIECGVEDDAPVYCLTIGNHSEMNGDLEYLERQLFDFAVSEGYADVESPQ